MAWAWMGRGLLVMGRGLLVAVAMSGASSRAYAEPGDADRLAAELLFREARQLMREGRAAEACPKLSESQRLDPGIGTLLNLALCYEESGKIASAWFAYNRAADEARAAGHSGREGLARERLAALEPQLPRLVVALPAEHGITDLRVEIDGAIVARPLWESGLPLDPGEHRVTVSAPGRKPWMARIAMERARTLGLNVPSLESTAQVIAPTRERALPASVARRLEVAGARTEGLGARRVAALALGGAGTLGIAVGAVFGLSAKSRYDESASECWRADACTREGRAIRDDAYDQAALSTVTFGTGATALVGAAILWFTANDDARNGSAVSASVGTAEVALGVGQATAVVRW